MKTRTDRPTAQPHKESCRSFEDYKNAALMRVLGEPPAPQTLTTLQHALTRGLEVVFQLEEGEILTEPTPSRERRRAILAFEATEGGAGVLGRLVAEGDAIARVARAALDLMHLENIDAAAASRDPSLLRDKEGARVRQGLLSLPPVLLQPARPRAD